MEITDTHKTCGKCVSTAAVASLSKKNYYVPVPHAITEHTCRQRGEEFIDYLAQRIPLTPLVAR